MKKMTNKKGFTLMEMLIVVAIIAILVAIAIPTFTSSLNKARIATDQANLRAAYAEQKIELMTNDAHTIDKAIEAIEAYTCKASGASYTVAGTSYEDLTITYTVNGATTTFGVNP